MHMQARTRKLEAESKLAGLQKDLAELGSVSGDQAGQEEAQTMQLHQVCPATTIILVKAYCLWFGRHAEGSNSSSSRSDALLAEGMAWQEMNGSVRWHMDASCLNACCHV